MRASRHLGGPRGDRHLHKQYIGVIVSEIAGEEHNSVRASLSYVRGDDLEAPQLQGAANIDGIRNGLEWMAIPSGRHIIPSYHPVGLVWFGVPDGVRRISLVSAPLRTSRVPKRAF